jgi:hypothetical protein
MGARTLGKQLIIILMQISLMKSEDDKGSLEKDLQGWQLHYPVTPANVLEIQNVHAAPAAAAAAKAAVSFQIVILMAVALFNSCHRILKN